MTPPRIIRRSPVPLSECNLARSFEMIGDRWSLLILRSALYGVRRFDDFREELNAPRSVLSARLKNLVAEGMMERREYREDGQRKRAEYPLTPMGRALALPFMAMTDWADKWLAHGAGPLALRSKSTGQTLHAAFVDEEGRAVRRDDIETVVTDARNRS
jgi:DNA-binding HxlR family transcriptional regulator